MLTVTGRGPYQSYVHISSVFFVGGGASIGERSVLGAATLAEGSVSAQGETGYSIIEADCLLQTVLFVMISLYVHPRSLT